VQSGQVIPLLPTPDIDGPGWYIGGHLVLLPVQSAVGGGIQFTFQNWDTDRNTDGYFSQWNWAAQRNTLVGPMLASQTITATGTITATDGTTFKAWGFPWDPANGPGIPPNCRLHFSPEFNVAGDINDGFAGDRWWSSTGVVFLAPGNYTVSAPLSGVWTDVYGASSQDTTQQWDPWTGVYYVPQQAFAAALASPSGVGFTCGGGYYYGHGVAVEGGTATFSIRSFVIH
jgi:hypothetical protein